MDTLTTAESWKEHLNQKIGSAIRSNKYVSIKVLILYWCEGDEGFKTEGREFGLLLQDTFQYAIEEFAIPSSQSELHLRGVVNRILLELATTSEEKNASSLLIIHYGGHGDKNDDRHAGEERRAVWAAVQEILKEAESDVLLLLDCCFAAQAGRTRREPSKSRFEILAAAAMGMQTRMPADDSFTKILQKHVKAIFDETGFVLIPDLHQRLVHRMAGLYATPVHISFLQERSPIRLERYSDTLPFTAAEKVASNKLQGSFFQLSVGTRDGFSLSSLEEIVRWLSENAPPTITSLYVEKVVGTTSHIHEIVAGLEKDNSLMRAFEKPAVEEILSLWDNVKAISGQLVAQEKISTGNDSRTTGFWRHVRSILSQLNEENSTLVESLEWNILNSLAHSEEDTILQEAIDNSAVKSLGIANQLRLRQIIRLPSPQNSDITQTGDREIKQDNSDVLQEFKIYGPYINPDDFPDLTERVKRLAEILEAPKDTGFRALRCQRWYQKAIEYRYVLEFEIPPSYTVAENGYNSLQSAIQNTKGGERPTLNQRFRASLMLARAVQKWHSVGWVHQGISGPNIIFLTLKETRKVDYDNPFLQGFEFSRPSSDPSIGRPTDDVAFNVYRHPSRQGNSRKGHRKIHDIYSLGVVLLEIGLWQCAADIVYPSHKKPIPSGADMQKKLQTAARDRLGHYMGEAYKESVEKCLAASFDVNMDDENESKLARMFQKKVINSISQGVRSTSQIL
ncbi:hypothetical protein HYFRA_00010232 [Hymenoscyphus fraxineus]|uniref:Protein kinase domain-containing protein n=1 Tax=Hymenoscyphus fraxineus TaxID=746836 RepID=A0A9N9PTG5_9HELO|nr:hypothetical protein HYFRA_00010232 [Hymenoscyphus fraxineus]